MGITTKLVQWGWIDPKGRSLSWSDWQQRKKSNRIPVAYLRDESGRVAPIYNVFRSGFLRGKAA